MEESDKRRERLRAIRAEASQSENSNNIETPSVSGYLSNPLVETSAAAPAEEELHKRARFDFYTDPMSAFSANRRRSSRSDQISSHCLTPPVNSGSPIFRSPSPLPGPTNAGMTPLAHQFESHHTPDPRMYQPQGFGHSPIGMSSPFSMHQGNMEPSIGPGGAVGHYNFPSNQPRENRFPSPRFGPPGSPFNTGQGRAYWHNHCPNPGWGRGGHPSPSPSPSPSSRRGRGHWHGSSMSPGSGWRGGRGLGSGGRRFTMDRPLGPERFYDESMIEDPWKFLEPVVWREVDASFSSISTPDSSKSWMTRSIGTKKPKVSDATNKSGSQPSLAEYLASSFNEAVNDESSK